MTVLSSALGWAAPNLVSAAGGDHGDPRYVSFTSHIPDQLCVTSDRQEIYALRSSGALFLFRV